MVPGEKRLHSPCVPAMLVAALGLACSNSGLGSGTHDGGPATGGQTGGPSSSEATGGLGGTSSFGGAGASVGGTGGTDGSATTTRGGAGGATPICTAYPSCNNPGDQQATSGPGLDYSGDCPPERECYSLLNPCGSTLCVLPEGAHCDDPLLCNPGDTPEPRGFVDCLQNPAACYFYEKWLCGQYIVCMAAANQYGVVCSGAGSDGGSLEPHADGGSVGIVHCCGDGVVDTFYGEQCDFGRLNGVCLDSQMKPLDAGQFDPSDGGCPLGAFFCNCPAGTAIGCTTMCQIPFFAH